MGDVRHRAAPGGHGLLGYEVLVPGEDRLVNELSWEDGPGPARWQPQPTVFEARRARRGGGDPRRAGLLRRVRPDRRGVRGGRFRAADTLDGAGGRVRRGRPRRPRASLVYLYWGELDKVGHVHGCQSWEWGDELEAIDAELAPPVRVGALRHRGLRHRRPRHGRRPARPADRPRPRRRAGCRRPPRRRGGPGACSSTARRAPPPTSQQAWTERVGERAWIAQPRRGRRARAGSARSSPVDRRASATWSWPCATTSPSSTRAGASAAARARRAARFADRGGVGHPLFHVAGAGQRLGW